MQITPKEIYIHKIIQNGKELNQQLQNQKWGLLRCVKINGSVRWRRDTTQKISCDLTSTSKRPEMAQKHTPK